MSQQKRGLGRSLNDMGLDELLSNVNQPVSPTSQTVKEGELRHIDVDLIQPGQYQPRKEFDEDSLQELADSIRTQGIIQPIVLRKLIEGRFEIVAGERRWRAAQKAGLQKVPAIIKNISDEAAVAVALIENIQRENLNIIEEANALQRLIHEFKMSHQQVAETVGKSRTTVTNLLRLLTLEKDIRTMVERGDLEMGHARALLTLDNAKQLQAAKTIVAKELSVRETERLVKRLKQHGSAAAKTAPQRQQDPDIMSLQSTLADKLGASVQIDHSASGKGKLVIQYNDLDELDGILKHIQ